MKNNKGITLIALSVMIIVLIIIASVVTYSGISVLRDSKTKKIETELQTVQHAVLENYSKYLSTKDLPAEGGTPEYIIGTKISFSTAKSIADKMGVTLKVNNYDGGTSTDETQFYYRLQEAQLREIGVTSAIELDEDVDTYIVNYATGEVMNETQADKMVLYVYAVDLR